MNDAKFIRWLHEAAVKADEAAHDMDSSEASRNVAWGRCEAYYAVLRKLGVDEDARITS